MFFLDMGYLRLIVLILVLSLLFSVTSVAYKASFIQIDRFNCKSSGLLTSDYKYLISPKKFDFNSSKSFNQRLILELNKSKRFNVTSNWNFQHPSQIYYNLWYNINNPIITLETEGDWYLLRMNLPDNVSLDTLEREYYNRIQYDLGEVRYAMYVTINEARDSGCIVGSGSSQALLEFFNFYEYPIKDLNCKSNRGSIFTDCFDDPIVTKATTNLWHNTTQEDRRGYIWFGNRIFVNMDQLFYNREEGLDFMQRSMIIFSESEFSSSLESGQIVFVDHVKHLKRLEELPFVIEELKNDITNITNFTNNIYHNLGLIRDEKQKGNDTNVQILINKNQFDYNRVQYYLDRLQYYQNKYYTSLDLANDNPRKYYEDMHKASASKYLAELNSRLIIFKDKLDTVRDLQSFYDSFTSNIISDINERQNINIAIGALVISLLLSLYLAHKKSTVR